MSPYTISTKFTCFLVSFEFILPLFVRKMDSKFQTTRLKYAENLLHYVCLVRGTGVGNLLYCSSVHSNNVLYFPICYSVYMSVYIILRCLFVFLELPDNSSDPYLQIIRETDSCFTTISRKSVPILFLYFSF